MMYRAVLVIVKRNIEMEGYLSVHLFCIWLRELSYPCVRVIALALSIVEMALVRTADAIFICMCSSVRVTIFILLIIY